MSPTVKVLETRYAALISMADVESNEARLYELYSEMKTVREQIQLATGATDPTLSYLRPLHEKSKSKSNSQEQSKSQGHNQITNLRAQQNLELEQSMRDDAARAEKERVASIKLALAAKRRRLIEEKVQAEIERAEAQLSSFRTSYIAPRADPSNIRIKVVFDCGQKAGVFRPTDRVYDLFGFSVDARARMCPPTIWLFDRCTLTSTMQTLVLYPTDHRTLCELGVAQSAVFHLAYTDAYTDTDTDVDTNTEIANPDPNANT